MGLVQKETLVVFYIRMPREIERHQRKKWRTGVSSIKPAVNNEPRRKGNEQASSPVPTGKGQTDDKSSTSLEASPANRAKIPCLREARCKRSSCGFRHPPVCPSRGVIQKGEVHERNPCVPKFQERTPEETSRQEECVRKAALDWVRNIRSRPRTKPRFILLWK